MANAYHSDTAEEMIAAIKQLRSVSGYEEWSATDFGNSATPELNIQLASVLATLLLAQQVERLADLTESR